MPDQTINRFVGSGTAAEMAAFTPDPPTPASGPDNGYVFFNTDDATLYAWDGAAWVAAGGGGGGGGMVLLEQHTASASASLEFTTCISSTYDDYVIELVDVVPATDNVDLYFQVSTDGGATWVTAGGSYFWAFQFADNTTAFGVLNDASYVSTAAALGVALDTTAAAGLIGLNGQMRIYKPLTAAIHKFSADTVYYNNSSRLRRDLLFGWVTAATAFDAFRFLMSSGNIASGTIRVYGLEK
jgi:hypothetical protein